jgi:hypothetical protein
MSVSENIKFSVVGHATIKGKQDGKVYLDKTNAIHPEHIARIFARALAGENFHSIYALHLGNGGSFIDSTGKITYNNPKTTGNAQLYDRTYYEVVDGTGPPDNHVSSSPSPTDLTSIVTISCTVSADEPAGGQLPTDSADNLTPANPDGSPGIPAGFGYSYNFDELALVAKDPALDNTNADNHILLTHLIFSPIQKSANRELVLTYTLTISVS